MDCGNVCTCIIVLHVYVHVYPSIVLICIDFCLVLAIFVFSSSSIKIKSLGNFKNIILLEESCSNHTKSINEKEQTIQSIRSRIHALQIERLKIQSEVKLVDFENEQ